MLTDEQRSQPVTVQDVADALTWVMLETFAALHPKGGSIELEAAANQLLETGKKIGSEPGRSIVLALAQNLIETEAGIFYEGK